MTSRLRPSAPGAVLALGLALAAPAGAQLLTNPDFDSNVDGWTAGPLVELEWSALDAGDDLESGSARVTNLHDSALDASGAYQCVETQPETAYWVRSWIVVPAEEPDSTAASLSYQFFSQAGCTGDVLAFGSSRELSGFGSDVWQCRGVGFTTTASASSLRLRISVFKESAGGETSAHFDDLLLLEGLFFDDFECGDDALWSERVD